MLVGRLKRKVERILICIWKEIVNKHNWHPQWYEVNELAPLAKKSKRTWNEKISEHHWHHQWKGYWAGNTS